MPKNNATSNTDYVTQTDRAIAGRQPDGSSPTGSQQDGSVTNEMLADMAANTIKANATASAAAPQDVAVAASRILARLASGNLVDATTTQIQALAGWAWTNAQHATMATLTIKGNNTGGASVPIDLTVAQVLVLLGLNGGITTTITTAPLTALGATGSMTFTNGILTASTPAT